jgi:hypothetical protein
MDLLERVLNRVGDLLQVHFADDVKRVFRCHALIAYYTDPPETMDVTEGESAEYGSTAKDANRTQTEMMRQPHEKSSLSQFCASLSGHSRSSGAIPGRRIAAFMILICEF